MQDCFSKRIYLGIGSNLGNRLKNIAEAFQKLGEKITKPRTASAYETEPMYFRDQPLYLNTVFEGYTDLEAEKLLDFVNMIESEAGRDRSREVLNGPRIIDIDILLYDSNIIESGLLTIPHKGIKERAFVLIPLLELNDDLQDPCTGTLYKDYLAGLDKQYITRHHSCRYLEKYI